MAVKALPEVVNPAVEAFSRSTCQASALRGVHGGHGPYRRYGGQRWLLCSRSVAGFRVHWQRWGQISPFLRILSTGPLHWRPGTAASYPRAAAGFLRSRERTTRSMCDRAATLARFEGSHLPY